MLDAELGHQAPTIRDRLRPCVAHVFAADVGQVGKPELLALHEVATTTTRSGVRPIMGGTYATVAQRAARNVS